MRIFPVIAVVVIGTLFSTGDSQAQRRSPSAPPSISSPQAAPSGPFLEAWTGVAANNAFFGGYFGAVAAMNQSHNLWTDGFVWRVDGLVGNYKVDPEDQSEFHVSMYSGDILAGYRMWLGGGLLTVYGGIDLANHSTPDRQANVRGEETGAKGVIEYYRSLGRDWFFFGYGYYTGAFNGFGTYGQLGYQVVEKVWIGPEVTWFGINDAPFRNIRGGGFIKAALPWNPLTSVSLSGGYEHPLTGGPDGYYVNFSLGWSFYSTQ